MNLNQEITTTMKLWEIVLHHVIIWGTLFSLGVKLLGAIGTLLERIIFRKEHLERTAKIFQDYQDREKAKK